jgi:hypothetical protein
LKSRSATYFFSSARSPRRPGSTAAKFNLQQEFHRDRIGRCFGRPQVK